MSKRLRIRLMLVIAACVMGAGVATALIQRAASSADFGEYSAVTSLRTGMLAQYAALQEVLNEPSSRTLERFTDARHTFQVDMARALARDEERAEIEALEQQERLADAWTERAEASVAAAMAPRDGARPRSDDPERRRLLRAFLAANGELLADLSEERTGRQRTALLYPIGLVGLLTLLSAGLLWAGVERPARQEGRRRLEQDELSGALQVSRSEPEAYDVLARHLARSTPSSEVTILNRDNSSVRLEPVTPMRSGSAVAAGLEGAGPDSCLAIRMAAPHKADPDARRLLSCEVCGKSPARTTCMPSLVGGEVIGAVLVEHAAALDEHTDRQIADSVAEAPPVIANLRNLAIAEMRAATDGLTGLPNQRAVHETLKRMVAQAGRTVEPLAMVLFDLDHFKAVNDTFGHGRGDDVLAAVGDATAHTIRGSDFAGRLGGEEFAVLPSATGREGALKVAENLRAAIAGLTVAGVDRPITASFGVAVLPDDAPDAQVLLRVADRALYQAKANGRDRVETAAV